MKNKAKWLSMSVLSLTPLLATGCNPYEVGFTMLGSFVWWDLALIPARALLGGLALDVINLI